MNPFVSVIIPNYNHAKYLDQRLQTVLNQTYQNFEVIILDDKSTDNSLEVISKYRDNPHVSQIVVNEQNSGSTFKQWDKGIQLAKGEVIWIAESDDYCENNMLAELVNAYTKCNNCALAYTTTNVVSESSEIMEQGRIDHCQFFKGKSYIKRYLSLANFVRNASCAIFSREAAISIPKDYELYKGAGDYLFWVNIALYGNVAIVNSALNYFRRHTGVVTATRDTDGTNFMEEKKILSYIETNVRISWLRKQGILYYHWSRITCQKYDNDSIRQILYEMWNVPVEYTVVQRIIKKIMGIARVKFNYYL